MNTWTTFTNTLQIVLEHNTGSAINAMTDLSEEQILEFKDAFSLFDERGDGKVEKTRVPDIVRSLGLNPLKQDVEKVKENLKSNKDRISFEEFLPIYVPLAKKQAGSAEEFVEALKMFDREGNGKIRAAELRRMLTAIGDKLTESQADVIVGIHEVKGGFVDYEKLVSEVMSQ